MGNCFISMTSSSKCETLSESSEASSFETVINFNADRVLWMDAASRSGSSGANTLSDVSSEQNLTRTLHKTKNSTLIDAADEDAENTGTFQTINHPSKLCQLSSTPEPIFAAPVSEVPHHWRSLAFHSSCGSGSERLTLQSSELKPDEVIADSEPAVFNMSDGDTLSPVEHDLVSNNIVLLQFHKEALPQLCRPDMLMQELNNNRTMAASEKFKVITNQQLGFCCLPKSGDGDHQKRLMMLLPRDSRHNAWRQLSRLARHRSLLALERLTNCRICVAAGFFLYSGRVVKPFIIDGPSTDAVLRCRNCLPASLRSAIISHDLTSTCSPRHCQSHADI